MSLRKRNAEQKKKANARERKVFSNICFFLLSPTRYCSFSRKPKVSSITAYNRRRFIMKVKSLDFIIAKNLSFRHVEGKKPKT